ncbi:hypothetical protein WH52_09475 [Tenacibaculum holothuriorum]|uniref:HTH araC/xylS-type domain-containing protein n=1 Tax=Tenacibaculum holothuriorum TaxID=1635173 RepID=A0A1Y2PDA0_9FLAO|nr:helix-turn-helix domain-containing protein [Tenacibaculum holothuriorum]OSY87658.1 hypothetical protein WH52_09475 [Tenacibaculum holothuriorum]
MFLSPRHTIYWKVLGEDTIHEKIDYLILFKPEFLSFSETVYDIYKTFPFFNHNANPIFRISDELKKYFKELIEKIYFEYQNNKQDSIEYIRSYLTIFLLTAKRELMHSTKTITEVAFLLGFEDVSNFVKYFKKQTGVTPLKFIKT